MKKINGRALMVHLIGFIISRANFYGMNPLAVGYFTASYLCGGSKVLSFAAAITGIFSVMDFTGIIKYSLTFIASVIIIEAPVIKKHPLPIPLLYAIPSLALFAFSLLDGVSKNSLADNIVISVLEVAIAVISAVIFKYGTDYIMQKTKTVRMDNEQMLSLALMVAACVYAVPDLKNAYVSLLYSGVYFIILLFTYKFGVGFGSITGAVCGLGMALKGAPAENIGIYAVTGILPAAFRESGRIPVAVSYIATAFLMSFLSPSMALTTEEISALITAVLIFLLLPARYVLRADAAGSGRQLEFLAAQNLKKIAETRMKIFSESFLKLSKTLDKISKNYAGQKQKEIDLIFEEISEKLCKGCVNCNQCWENNFQETYKAACLMLETAQRKGSLEKEDVPESFLSDCICADDFIRETNMGFELVRLNNIWQSRMAESRELIAQQLKEVSGVISDITDEIYDTVQESYPEEELLIRRLKAEHIVVKDLTIFERLNKRKEIYMTAAVKGGRSITAKEAAAVISEALGRKMKVSEASKSVIGQSYECYTFVEDTKFKLLTGVAKANKDNVSGDNFSILKMETGECMLALADGMGTGTEAGEESETVMSLLEQMIEAGFKAETAIKLINSSLVMKSDRQSFSTLDLAMINLFTGMCEFIKIGAAASFIKRDSWVETISSDTLPVGMLKSVDYDIVTKKLYEGDIIVMVTDGVLDSIDEIDKEACLEEVILDIKSNNPQEIANQILERMLAKSNYSPRDDMTVLCAGIWLK